MQQQCPSVSTWQTFFSSDWTCLKSKLCQINDYLNGRPKYKSQTPSAARKGAGSHVCARVIRFLALKTTSSWMWMNVFIPLMDLSFFSFQDLVELFNFHNYDNLRHFAKKHDPRREGGDQRVRTHNIMLWGTNHQKRHQTHTPPLQECRWRWGRCSSDLTAVSILHQLLCSCWLTCWSP